VAQQKLNVLGAARRFQRAQTLARTGELHDATMSRQRQCTQPFLYNVDNLMAGAAAEAAGSPPVHDIAPRHIREYTAIVERALGGVWESAPR
jgi:hypothetical protein